MHSSLKIICDDPDSEQDYFDQTLDHTLALSALGGVQFNAFATMDFNLSLARGQSSRRGTTRPVGTGSWWCLGRVLTPFIHGHTLRGPVAFNMLSLVARTKSHTTLA